VLGGGRGQGAGGRAGERCAFVRTARCCFHEQKQQQQQQLTEIEGSSHVAPESKQQVRKRTEPSGTGRQAGRKAGRHSAHTSDGASVPASS